MKTKLIFRVVLLIFITICVSCSKDSTPQETNPNVLRAKVGGVLASFNAVLLDMEFENSYAILGNDGDCNKQINLKFSKDLEIGTYTFDTNDFSAIYKTGDVCCYFDCDYVYTYYAIEGSLTLIESNGAKIKGTFHFIGEKYDGEKRVITEGIFELEY